MSLPVWTLSGSRTPIMKRDAQRQIMKLQKLATLYHIPLQNFISLQLGSVPAAENTLSESALCPGLSAQELQLLSSFRRLSPQDQQDITDFIRVKLEREL